jgi:DUF1680 family protein
MLTTFVALLALAAPREGDPQLVNLREVPFTQVKIEDDFWAPRRKTNRDVSLAHSLDMLEKTGNLANFDLAAQNKHEGYKGPVFSDSDLYKTLEAVSYSLATDPDPKLDARLDAIIARLAAAQRPDGYLNTWYDVNAPDQRFSNLKDNHELYCAGHLFEAAAAHFQATGKRSLLDVATRYADLLCKTFGDGPGQRPGYCGHPEVELALVKLSRVTGDTKYFDLAKHFLNARGSKFFATEHHVPFEKYNGEYWQDNVPIREHEHVVGHAVRFGYLMSAAVDVGAQTGDEGLMSMARRVWVNTTERNTYITGGIGPSASNEGFTHDYDLPNLSAYQETCASVAMAMWNHRLNLAYGDAKYADCVETALYNGVLSGVSLDGKKFFYVNPLESLGGHHRSDWFSCACCPPNEARTLAALGNYAYAAGDGLWVNLYIAGGVKAKVGSSELSLAVTTQYPWDGAVDFRVVSAPEGSVPIHLRVPGWCRGASASVNAQEPVKEPRLERGYLVIERAWKSGDTLHLDLPMPVRRVAANPNVADDRGKLAIARGPIVYCVEGMDVGAPLSSLSLPADAELSFSKTANLLGGVVAIGGRAMVSEGEWRGGLYGQSGATRTVPFAAVPYYAWDNRSAGAMRVWLPTSPPPARVVGPESSAKVTLSFTSDNCEPEGIHDGAEVHSSGEQPAACCHWWPHKGTVEWAQYTWDSPRRVSGASVYWFDDSGRGECRVPKGWRILYKDGEEWKPVAARGKYDVAKDRWCEVNFEPVTTTALRLEVQMQDKWAAGVHEWRVVAAQE